MTFLPSLHRQISLVAVILFPHSTSPGLSSMSISYPPLPGTTDSTAKTFSSHPSTRPPTSSTSFQRRERSYLRLGDCAWSYWASYELLTECIFRTCSEPVSPALSRKTAFFPYIIVVQLVLIVAEGKKTLGSSAGHDGTSLRGRELIYCHKALLLVFQTNK